MPFDHLGLSPELLRAVEEEGYTEPTPIQEKAIPIVLRGADLMARAQTGTGKTAAFALPILERMQVHANKSFSPARHPIRVLVVTPTRELAIQVHQSFKSYGRHVGLRSTIVYGGVPMGPQEKDLLGGVEIVVATPGRLLDHAGSRTLNLGQVEVLVLDEGDRMLDMGFIDDIRRILALLPAKRQNLLFSATLDAEVRSLASTFLNEPESVDVAPTIRAAESVEQVAYLVDADRKRELLSFLVRSRDLRQVLVFTRTKQMTRRLASQLDRGGVEATAIHGDRTQPERERALEQFKSGEVRVLVATDVAARGLDIEALPVVVNYEIPTTPRTTCIGSAALAEPAWRAWPSRWSRSTRRISSRASTACSSVTFPFARFAASRSTRHHGQFARAAATGAAPSVVVGEAAVGAAASPRSGSR